MTMTNPATPTKIIFGLETFRQLPTELKALQVNHPLVVCGRHFAHSAEGRELRLLLENADFFVGVEENPLMTTVDAMALEARKQKCDSIIGIGGGSVLDSAKVATCLRGSQDCAAFVASPKKVENALPFVA